MPLFASQRSTSCSAVILKNNNVARAPMAKAVKLPFFSTAEALYERATETERELFIGGYCTCTYCVQKCKFSIDFVSETILQTNACCRLQFLCCSKILLTIVTLTLTLLIFSFQVTLHSLLLSTHFSSPSPRSVAAPYWDHCCQQLIHALWTHPTIAHLILTPPTTNY